MESTTRPGGNAVRITEPVFDLATEKGRWHIRQLRVGDYLEQQDVFNREGQTVRFAPVVTFNWTAGAVQRAVLDIRKNPIKKRMLRDLMRVARCPRSWSTTCTGLTGGWTWWTACNAPTCSAKR